MTTQKKRLVAQAGVEPTAQAYETRMLPLHYRAASPRVGTIGVEPIRTVLQTAALPLELYSRMISYLKRAEDKGLEPSSRHPSRTALAVRRSKPISAYLPFFLFFLFNAERVTGPLQRRFHWITKGL